MSECTSPPSSGSTWRPRGLDAWAITLLSCVVLVATAVLAHYMVKPYRWDGLGRFGALALFFPIHLLGVSFAAILLVTIAVTFRARVAAWLFSVVVIMTVAMAAIPTIAIRRQARQWNARAAFRAYALFAAHMNSGSPQLNRSVVYGTAKDGTKLELDVWQTGRPKTGRRRPAVLMLHGGMWTNGNRSGMPDWNRWLNDLGYEVFDVEYRVPPPVRWLDEVGDVKSALGWIVAHADDYYVDPKRISAMGGSAGANLAMLAAYSVDSPALPPSTNVPRVAIRSVINLYGPTDMTLLYKAGTNPEYVQPLLRQYIGGSPDECPDRYRELSPLTHITTTAPPTLTILGASDRLVSVDHATLLDHALSNANVPHEVYLLPANDHGFDVNWGGLGTQIARAKIRSFLKRYG